MVKRFVSYLTGLAKGHAKTRVCLWIIGEPELPKALRKD